MDLLFISAFFLQVFINLHKRQHINVCWSVHGQSETISVLFGCKKQFTHLFYSFLIILSIIPTCVLKTFSISLMRCLLYILGVDHLRGIVGSNGGEGKQMGRLCVGEICGKRTDVDQTEVGYLKP